MGHSFGVSQAFVWRALGAVWACVQHVRTQRVVVVQLGLGVGIHMFDWRSTIVHGKRRIVAAGRLLGIHSSTFVNGLYVVSDQPRVGSTDVAGERFEGVRGEGRGVTLRGVCGSVDVTFPKVCLLASANPPRPPHDLPGPNFLAGRKPTNIPL